jgi:hypothetical protein
MRVSIDFDPAIDSFATISAVVSAAYPQFALVPGVAGELKAFEPQTSAESVADAPQADQPAEALPTDTSLRRRR